MYMRTSTHPGDAWRQASRKKGTHTDDNGTQTDHNRHTADTRQTHGRKDTDRERHTQTETKTHRQRHGTQIRTGDVGVGGLNGVYWSRV